jgi:hypothetical protein
MIMTRNYRQIYAIEKANKERILQVCPDCPDRSGIYFLLREENGFRWAYIGQARKLCTRLAQHLNGYQHIDLSLKKHGLWSDENPTGWRVHYLEFPQDQLDEMEQKYIKNYANKGYQLRNHESGGHEGKVALESRNSSRGYYDGLAQGHKNAQKMIAHLFDKHLVVSTKKNPPTVNQQKALDKFMNFINWEEEKGDENE